MAIRTVRGGLRKPGHFLWDYGFRRRPVRVVEVVGFVLSQEDGSPILQEDGSFILLDER